MRLAQCFQLQSIAVLQCSGSPLGPVRGGPAAPGHMATGRTGAGTSECVCHQVRERDSACEHASLFPSDYISLGLEKTRNFFKLANKFPKFLQALDGFIPHS